MQRRHREAMVGLALIVLALFAAPAQAAFPGANGRLSLNHNLVNFGQSPAGWTMNANGTDQREIVAAPPVNGPGSGGPTRHVASALRFSPNGRQVVYSWFPFAGTCVQFNGPDQPTQLVIANVDGTGARNLTQLLCGSAVNGSITLRNDDIDPAWSPDGARVVFTSRRRCIQQRDPQCQSKTEIWSVSVNGGSLRQLTAGPDDAQPNWGTNNRIAFVRSGDIWTMNPDGSGQTQVTSGPGNDVEPNWSPDGQKIVFSSNRDEPGPDCGPEGSFRCHYEIYSMNANGTGLTRLTTRPGLEDMAPVYSPDGTKIAWNGDGENGIDIWTMNADGTAQTDVTDATRPGSPFTTCCGDPFSAFYTKPDWQPVTGIPPALPAPALRTQMDPPFTYAGKPSATGTVFISERAPSGGTVVSLSSSDPAHASVPPSVTIPAGAQKADYRVTLTTPAADETVTFTATIPGRSATTSIDLHPPPSDVDFFVSGGATSVRAGQDLLIGANLNEPAAVGGTVVTFSSSDPSAAPVPASQTYPEGIGGGGFFVHAGAVTTSTPVTLTAHLGAVTRTVSFTVTPGPQLSSLTLAQTSVTGPTSVNATVTMSAAPDAFETLHVALSSSDTTVATVPAEVTIFGTTTTTASFPVSVSQVTAQKTVTITATFAGVSKTATLTVNPPAAAAGPTLSSLAFSPASVTGGNSSTGTVRLSAAAPAGGVSVGLSSPSASVSVPASVPVPAGQTSATFTATTRAVTTSTPVDVTASLPGSANAVGRLTVTPAATAADTVAVTRADYDSAKRELRVEATSSSATATLIAFNDTTGARIGTLSNNGGGSYRGQFTGVDNPGTVRVISSLGGSATRTVAGASGTVRPGVITPVAAAPGVGAKSTAPSSSARPVLHVTPEIALPAPAADDVRAPAISRLRVLPRRFRLATRRGTLVSLTLSEPARVRLSVMRLHRSRFSAVPGAIVRTLPAGRVRIRFEGRLGGHALAPGVYRVVVAAFDAAGHPSASAHVLVFVRR
jgi:hypothetical protein